MRSLEDTSTDYTPETPSPGITRRCAIKLISTSLVLCALPSLAESHETEIEDFVVEHIGQNLNQLHSEAANQFANTLGEKLRKENNLVVTSLSICLSNPDNNGFYSLSFRACFRQAKSGEKPDRHVDRRGTMLADLRTIREENIRKAYRELNAQGQNWLESMEEQYGEISTIEIAKSKNDHFFIEEWFVITK